MSSVKQSRTQAINRTEAAAAGIVGDLCGYIERNKHNVNSGQTKLLHVHGNDGLTRRHLKGMPKPLKVVVG